MPKRTISITQITRVNIPAMKADIAIAMGPKDELPKLQQPATVASRAKAAARLARGQWYISHDFMKNVPIGCKINTNVRCLTTVELNSPLLVLWD